MAGGGGLQDDKQVLQYDYEGRSLSHDHVRFCNQHLGQPVWIYFYYFVKLDHSHLPVRLININ